MTSVQLATSNSSPSIHSPNLSTISKLEPRSKSRSSSGNYSHVPLPALVSSSYGPDLESDPQSAKSLDSNESQGPITPLDLDGKEVFGEGKSARKSWIEKTEEASALSGSGLGITISEEDQVNVRRKRSVVGMTSALDENARKRRRSVSSSTNEQLPSAQDSSSKRSRVQLIPLDSLATAASSALSTLPLPPARLSIDERLKAESMEQAQQIKSAMSMRSQQLREIERRRAVPGTGHRPIGSNGLSTALGKIRADRDDFEGSGLGLRRKGKALTVSTASNGNSLAPLRSAPLQPQGGLSGPSISRSGLSTAYPSLGGAGLPYQSSSNHSIPPFGTSVNPRGVGISRQKVGIQPYSSGISHQDLHYQPGGYTNLPSQLQQLQQQQSALHHTSQRPLAVHSSQQPPKSAHYLHPLHHPSQPRYSPPTSRPQSPPHHYKQQHLSPHTPLPPPSPGPGSSKATFLSLFSTFYDSLSDSRVLSNTLEDQLRRSATLLTTLQDSGKVFENMLDDRLRTIVRDLSNDLLLCERRIEQLEAAAENDIGSRGRDDGSQRGERMDERLDRLEEGMKLREGRSTTSSDEDLEERMAQEEEEDGEIGPVET